jgi:Nucleolar protein,Nop52
MNKKRDKDTKKPAAEASGKVEILAQELKFAKMLASNDPKIRSGVLKTLKKWLNTRSQSSYRKYSAHLMLLVKVFNIKCIKMLNNFFYDIFIEKIQKKKLLYLNPVQFAVKKICHCFIFQYVEIMQRKIHNRIDIF